MAGVAWIPSFTFQVDIYPSGEPSGIGIQTCHVRTSRLVNTSSGARETREKLRMQERLNMARILHRVAEGDISSPSHGINMEKRRIDSVLRRWCFPYLSLSLIIPYVSLIYALCTHYVSLIYLLLPYVPLIFPLYTYLASSLTASVSLKYFPCILYDLYACFGTPLLYVL